VAEEPAEAIGRNYWRKGAPATHNRKRSAFDNLKQLWEVEVGGIADTVAANGLEGEGGVRRRAAVSVVGRRGMGRRALRADAGAPAAESQASARARGPAG
jgi:hypothetical protein